MREAVSFALVHFLLFSSLSSSPPFTFSLLLLSPQAVVYFLLFSAFLTSLILVHFYLSLCLALSLPSLVSAFPLSDHHCSHARRRYTSLSPLTPAVMARVVNFSAGPSTLPEAVLQQAQADMLSWHGKGLSVMGTSSTSTQRQTYRPTDRWRARERGQHSHIKSAQSTTRGERRVERRDLHTDGAQDTGTRVHLWPTPTSTNGRNRRGS